MKKRFIALFLIAVMCVTAFSTLTVSAADINEVMPRAVTYGYITGDVVNVRAGAGSNYSPVGTLTIATRVMCYGKTGAWVHVYANGVEGYVSAAYYAAETMMYTVVNGPLNLRQAESTTSNILGVLLNGARVLRIDTTAEPLGSYYWYHVMPVDASTGLKGVRGYCSSQYLRSVY